jgi:hypothetical protein
MPCLQDADNVLILQRYQDLYYVDVRKNRYDGELGAVPLAFGKHDNRLRETTGPRFVKNESPKEDHTSPVASPRARGAVVSRASS